MPDLVAAVAAEAELRSDLAGLVQRSRALRDEAAALRRRSGLDGADARLCEVAGRLDAEADRLDARLEPVRAQVREAEGTVAVLRAEVLGA